MERSVERSVESSNHKVSVTVYINYFVTLSYLLKDIVFFDTEGF